MASDQRRRRRAAQAPPSPTSLIVNFFLDHQMEIAEAALELAQTIMARRRAGKALPVGPVVPVPAPAPVVAPPPTPPTPAPLAKEAAPEPMPATPPRAVVTRQRAKRSDAGKPRKQPGGTAASTAAPVSAAAATPTSATRRRPALDTPVPVAPIVVPELPAQDVPFEARDVDVD